LTPCLQPYEQNLLNFRHHFLFGVPSKISSFWHYFTDKALNILFKFVCRLRNVSKNKNFEFSHNLKWYIIRISFERVLRNIQKNLLLIRTLFSHFTTYSDLTGLTAPGLRSNKCIKFTFEISICKTLQYISFIERRAQNPDISSRIYLDFRFWTHRKYVTLKKIAS
jgi:hypothetical protein